MSTANDVRTYAMDPLAFGDALVNFGHSIALEQKQRYSNFIEMRERFSLFSWSWPVTVTATIEQSGEQLTVNDRARNLGWGPIQHGHVKRLLQRVTDAMSERDGTPLHKRGHVY